MLMRISKVACATNSIKVWGYFMSKIIFLVTFSSKMTNFAASKIESCFLWGLYQYAMYKRTYVPKSKTKDFLSTIRIWL